MKRLILTALVLAISAGPPIARAQTTPVAIDQLPGAGTPTGTELLPAEQVGRAVAMTVNQIRSFTTSNLPAISLSINGAGGISGILQVPNGGTGATTLTGLILGNGAAAFSGYPGATCSNQFLRNLSASGVPTCNAVNLASDVTGTLPVGGGGSGATSLTGLLVGNGASPFTVYAGAACSNTFLRNLSSTGVATCNAVNLSSDITSVLSVPNGGSGNSALTAHGVLIGEGANPITALAAMAIDTLLQGRGAADPGTVAVPNCGSSTQALAYSTSTHTFACQTISTSGVGTVTSVGLSLPAWLTIGGTNPITSSGTFNVTGTSEPANLAMLSPNGTAGPVAPRAIALPDLPAINLAGTGNGGVFGNLPMTNLGSGTGASATTCLHGNATWSNCVITSANPSAKVGPTAVNGTATTFMTSDSAPGINLTATYPWTGPHTFGAGLTAGASIALKASGEIDANSTSGTLGQVLTSQGSGNAAIWSSVSAPTTGANPTATVGPSVSNGVATTFMRSDASPPVCLSCSFPWTGTHMFSGGITNSVAAPGVNIGASAGAPVFRLVDTNGATNTKAWQMSTNSPGTVFSLQAVSDDWSTTFTNALTVTRSAATIADVSIGNPTDNSTFHVNGTGSTTLSGDVTLNQPPSGTVLTVTAVSGSPAVINGANAAGGSALSLVGNFTGAGNTSLLKLTDPNNTNGANLELTGNGATTPNKYLRVAGGTFQVLNSGYTASLLSIADNGNQTISSNGANQIVFASAPSTFTSQIFVGANGNAQSASLLMQQDTGHNGYIRNQDTGSLFLGVGSTNFWSITPSGGLTNGTVPASGAALALKSLATSSAETVDSSAFGWTTHGAIDMGTTGAIEADNGTTTWVNNGYFANPNWTYKTTAAASFVRQDASGNVIVETAPSGTAGTAISGLVNRFEVGNNGGVTVGSATNEGAGTFDAPAIYQSGVPVSTTTGTVTGVTAGTGLTGGTITGSGTIGLATPVSVANGGTGTATPGLVAGTNVTILGTWPNQTVSSSASGASGANPTGSVGLSAINGSATTFMRSDAAPQLNTSISPTMTGTWTFTPSGGVGAVINGTSGNHIANFISGSGSTTVAADMYVSRSGSTANSLGEGANIQLQDSVNNNGSLFQNSGGQTELWQNNGGSWVQALHIGASDGLIIGAPPGGDKGSGTLNAAGTIYQNNTPVCLSDGTNCPASAGQSTGSFTLTVVTCTGSPSFSASYVKVGLLVTVSLASWGSSCNPNISTPLIQANGLPSAIQPAHAQDAMIPFTDSTVGGIVVEAGISGGSMFFKRVQPGNFSGSGTVTPGGPGTSGFPSGNIVLHYELN